MKKTLFHLTLLLATWCWSAVDSSAQSKTMKLPVKMTYIDYDQPDMAFGELQTIEAGFNKAAAAGYAIDMGNTSWGDNKVGIVCADVSLVPGTVQSARLLASISGSTDSQRPTSWGVALTDNPWADGLTYATAGGWTVAALLNNNGKLVMGTQKDATTFEEVSFAVTPAFTGGQKRATLLVYETAAAGGYMKDACLEVTYEPYASTATTFDFEDGDIPFVNGTNSGGGRITAAIEYDAALASNVLGWTCAGNAQNGYSFSYYDFTSLLSRTAIVRLEFDYYNTQGNRSLLTIGDAKARGTDGTCSKTTYSPTGAVFRIGSTQKMSYVNDIALPLSDLCNKWLHVSVNVNSEDRTVMWTVTDQEGNTLHTGIDGFYDDNAVECTQMDVFGYINFSHCAMLDNLTVTNYVSTTAFADYIIQYVDANGSQVKAPRTDNGQVGKHVTLYDSDKESFYSEDGSRKFIYDTDDSETVVIGKENTVVTVRFRDAEKYYAILNCRIKGTEDAEGLLAQYDDEESQWFFEGDDITIYPSRGFAKGGTYYFTEPTVWNGTPVTLPGSVTAQVLDGKTCYIADLYYQPDADAAYYSDFERLALPLVDEGNGTGLGQLVGTVNSWYSFSGTWFDRFSGGRAICLNPEAYVYTEPIAEAATYRVSIYGRNNLSKGIETPYFLGLMRAGSHKVERYADLAIPAWGSATTGSSVVEGVAIPAGGRLVVISGGEDASKVSLDDLKLTATGPYTEPSVEKPATGDLNDDGGVNVGDVTTLVNMILGKAEKAEAGDLNGDGNINVGDVTTLVNVILGKGTFSDAAMHAGLCPDMQHPHVIDMGDAGKWACCNVGANNPFEYGGYYAWGETDEKEVYSLNTYLYYKDGAYVYPGDISGNTQYDVATKQWGDAWRMPTYDRIKLLLGCPCEWTTIGGANGYVFTALNGNRLFLPAAGYRHDTATDTDGAGSFGYFLSSTPYPSDSGHAYILYFHSGVADWRVVRRYYGVSVRPVAE